MKEKEFNQVKTKELVVKRRVNLFSRKTNKERGSAADVSKASKSTINIINDALDEAINEAIKKEANVADENNDTSGKRLKDRVFIRSFFNEKKLKIDNHMFYSFSSGFSATICEEALNAIKELEAIKGDSTEFKSKEGRVTEILSRIAGSSLVKSDELLYIVGLENQTVNNILAKSNMLYPAVRDRLIITGDLFVKKSLCLNRVVDKATRSKLGDEICDTYKTLSVIDEHCGVGDQTSNEMSGTSTDSFLSKEVRTMKGFKDFESWRSNNWRFLEGLEYAKTRNYGEYDFAAAGRQGIIDKYIARQLKSYQNFLRVADEYFDQSIHSLARSEYMQPVLENMIIETNDEEAMLLLLENPLISKEGLSKLHKIIYQDVYDLKDNDDYFTKKMYSMEEIDNRICEHLQRSRDVAVLDAKIKDLHKKDADMIKKDFVEKCKI